MNLSKGLDADSSMKSIPVTWIKYGYIYGDEKSRSVFICAACLEHVDNFEMGFQTNNPDTFWVHVQMLHMGPARRRQRRRESSIAKQVAAEKSQEALSIVEQTTKPVKVNDVAVVDIDDDDERDRIDDKDELNSDLVPKQQVCEADKITQKPMEISTADILSDIIMECKMENEIMATQTFDYSVTESQNSDTNINDTISRFDDDADDDDTVMYEMNIDEPTTDHSKEKVDNMNVTNGKVSDTEAEQSANTFSNFKKQTFWYNQHEKSMESNIQNENENEQQTEKENSNYTLANVKTEIKQEYTNRVRDWDDGDGDDTLTNNDSEIEEIQDEDLLCFFKEYSVAEYHKEYPIELSDDDDDDDRDDVGSGAGDGDAKRNITSALFSSTAEQIYKQCYDCTSPSCKQTSSDCDDFKEHLKTHIQEDFAHSQQHEKQQPQLQPEQELQQHQHQQIEKEQNERQQAPSNSYSRDEWLSSKHHQQKYQEEEENEEEKEETFSLDIQNDNNTKNHAVQSLSHTSQDPMRTSSVEKPHICEYCSLSYCHAWQLERHMRTHKPKKPTKTTKNDKPKTSQPTIRPFHCVICDMRTDSDSAMQKHIKQVHSGNSKSNTVMCSFCQRVLKKNSLPQHLLLHSDERCYKCQLCNYASKQKQTLNYHIKTKHAKEVTEHFSARRRKRRRTTNGNEELPTENSNISPTSTAAAKLSPREAMATISPAARLSSAEAMTRSPPMKKKPMLVMTSIPPTIPQLSDDEERELYAIFRRVHEQMKQNTQNCAIPNAAGITVPLQTLPVYYGNRGQPTPAPYVYNNPAYTHYRAYRNPYAEFNVFSNRYN